MPQIYQAQIVHFIRNRMAKGGIELKVRLKVEGYETVHFFTPIVYPTQENCWIDWNETNSRDEPKIKKKPGEILRIQGEIIDYGDWVLEGKVL